MNNFNNTFRVFRMTALGVIALLGLSACLVQEPQLEGGVDLQVNANDAILGNELVINNGLPNGLSENDDPNEVGWASVRNRTAAEMESKVAQFKSDGYRMEDLEAYVDNGAVRYAGVFRKNTDSRGWAAFANLSGAEFSDKWQYYKTHNYRLIDQVAYMDNGSLRYGGVWIENKENINWASFRDANNDDFNAKYQYYRDNGYIMIDFETYSFAGNRYYSAVFKKNAKGLDWKFLRDISEDEHKAQFSQLKSTYRITDIEVAQIGGELHYNVLWVENPNDRYWRMMRNLTDKAYGDDWMRTRDAGYRLTRVNTYMTDEGLRFAGLWRQNTDRPTWSLKGDIDTLVQNFADENKLPSLNVAIAKDGKFLYLRGLGFSNIENDEIAHSRTVYRLASVSKAMAGILTAKVAQNDPDNLDIKDLAAAHIGPLSKTHTYTIGDLLSCRSGIGEYPDYDDEPTDTVFTTAQDASQFLLSKPVPYTVGTYRYSTHGFTILGAVLESIAGKNIFDLFTSEITDAYDVPSLRPEILTDNVPYRAKFYRDGSDVVGADNYVDGPDFVNKPVVSSANSTWKVLGGGIESNAYDLARLGMKLLNGEILTEQMMDNMWTLPDNQSNFGYGWNITTARDKDGNSVLTPYRVGAFTGSETTFKVIPAKGIVIVALSNRRDPYSMSTLVGDIEDVLLQHY